MLLSFMSESRRLDNQRMKKELRLKLRYATVAQGLDHSQIDAQNPADAQRGHGR